MADEILDTIRAAAWFDIAQSRADAFKAQAFADGDLDGFSTWQGVSFVVGEFHDLVVQRNISGDKTWRAIPESVLQRFVTASKAAYADALADPKSFPLFDLAVWDYVSQVLENLRDTNDIEAALNFAVEMADFHG